MELVKSEELKVAERSALSDNWQSIAEELLTFIDSRYRNIYVTSNMVGINDVAAISFPAAPYTIFNPRIVYASEVDARNEEISPLHPGLKVKVKRPVEIRVRYQDMFGKTHTEKFQGMTARYLQQAIEVLDGDSKFFNKAAPLHKEQAMKKYRKAVIVKP